MTARDPDGTVTKLNLVFGVDPDSAFFYFPYQESVTDQQHYVNMKFIEDPGF